MISWKAKKGKYIFEKDGVFFALTPDQIEEMIQSLLEVKREQGYTVHYVSAVQRRECEGCD